MKVLVTGGLGFIGSHTVVQLYAAGHEAVIVDNLSNSEAGMLERVESLVGEDVPFYHVDCSDREALEGVFVEHADLGGIIHFAALKAVGESVREPLRYYRNNLLGLVNTVDLAGEYGVCNIVFSSSATVYGAALELPVREVSALQPPSSPYGATKLMGEQIVRDAVAGRADLRVLCLRYFNPIGAHPSGMLGELPQGVPNNLLPYITQTARGLREELVIFGDDYDTPDGTALRDYFHVMDLARAHVLGLRYLERCGADQRIDYINVGAGRPVSVLELVRLFERECGVRVAYRMGPRRAGDVEAVWADIERAERELGWTPEYSLGEALRHAWAWEKRLKEEAGGGDMAH